MRPNVPIWELLPDRRVSNVEIAAALDERFAATIGRQVRAYVRADCELDDEFRMFVVLDERAHMIRNDPDGYGWRRSATEDRQTFMGRTGDGPGARYRFAAGVYPEHYDSAPARRFYAVEPEPGRTTSRYVDDDEAAEVLARLVTERVTGIQSVQARGRGVSGRAQYLDPAVEAMGDAMRQFAQDMNDAARAATPIHPNSRSSFVDESPYSAYVEFGKDGERERHAIDAVRFSVTNAIRDEAVRKLQRRLGDLDDDR